MNMKRDRARLLLYLPQFAPPPTISCTTVQLIFTLTHIIHPHRHTKVKSKWIETKTQVISDYNLAHKAGYEDGGGDTAHPTSAKAARAKLFVSCRVPHSTQGGHTTSYSIQVELQRKLNWKYARSLYELFERKERQLRLELKPVHWD